MRIVLIVLLILVLLIVIVCLSSIVAEVSYWDESFAWCVKYFGIRILPRPKKPEPPEAASEEELPEEEASPPSEEEADVPASESPPEYEEPKPEEVPEPEEPEPELPEEKPKEKKTFFMDKLWQTLMDIVRKLDLVGSGLAALPGPLQKLLRAITWSDIETDILIAGEDAFKTAKLYGSLQALVQPLLGEAQHIINVKRKNVAIGCDFTEDKCRWNARCKIKVRIGPVLGAGIWLAWRFLMDCCKAKKTIVSDKL